MDTSNKTSNKKLKKFNYIYESFQKQEDEAKRLFSIFKDKEICLKVVDELEREIDSLFDKGFNNVHQVLETPMKIYKNIINPEKVFFAKLRQSIKNLSNEN